MTEPSFTATAAFDRQFVWKHGGSVRYLVARLLARSSGERRPSERMPLNIAVVIDASGSMAHGKLEAAKRATACLAERLTERDRLTVVSFASDVQIHLDALPVSAANAVRIRSEVSRLQTRGRTDLCAGWFAGVECAERVTDECPQMTPRVIILSDGHANEGIADPNELREHAHELRSRGTLTSALGIGDDYDEQLLRAISESGGGRLHDAELDSEISSVLLGELEDVFCTVVEDAQVTLTVPQGATAEVMGTANHERYEGRLTVQLGPIQNDVERVAVFKVKCPQQHEKGELRFDVTASGRAVHDRTKVETEAATASLFAVGGKTNNGQPRDTEVAETVVRAWSAHVVAAAARMNRDRDFRGAEKFVSGQLRYFRRYVHDLPHARQLVSELELLAERAAFDLSSRTRKEMVLQSSISMSGRADHRGSSKDRWSDRMARGR